MGDIINAGADILGFGPASKAADAQTQAAQTSANAQLQAAQIAAEAARFRPVGVTTGFGKSQFTTDAQGNLTGANYALTPELQAIRNRLMSQAGTYDPTLMTKQAAMLSPSAQSLFGLGQQLLPTSVSRQASPEALALAQQYQRASQGLIPTDFTTQASPEAQAYVNQLRGIASQAMPTSYDTTAAAQRYTEQQQNLLAPQREQQLANIRNQLFQTGRTGLATSGTAAGGMQATNPEMAAYYNSIAQQNAAITAGAEQQARANLASDISLGQQLGSTALTTQTNAEQLARQNMLQNLGLGLGFGTQGLGTTTSAEDLARARLAQDIGLGSGLFGTGASLLGQQTSLTSGAYSPLSTQLGLAGTVEGLGQQALGLGSELGGRVSSAGAKAGESLLLGGLTAAKTLGAVGGLQGMAQAQGLAGLLNNPALSSSNPQVKNWFSNILGSTPSFNTGYNVDYGYTPTGSAADTGYQFDY